MAFKIAVFGDLGSGISRVFGTLIRLCHVYQDACVKGKEVLLREEIRRGRLLCWTSIFNHARSHAEADGRTIIASSHCNHDHHNSDTRPQDR